MLSLLALSANDLSSGIWAAAIKKQQTTNRKTTANPFLVELSFN
jgi:hypothetical protein